MGPSKRFFEPLEGLPYILSIRKLISNLIDKRRSAENSWVRKYISRMSKSAHQILLVSKKHSLLTYPIVYAQSLVVIGTFFWIPYLIYYIMKKYNKTRERAITLLSFLFVLLVPVTKNKFIQNLFVWSHYARYFQTKVVGVPFSQKQSVFGIIPHGIVPLTLGDN